MNNKIILSVLVGVAVGFCCAYFLLDKKTETEIVYKEYEPTKEMIESDARRDSMNILYENTIALYEDSIAKLRKKDVNKIVEMQVVVSSSYGGFDSDSVIVAKSDIADATIRITEGEMYKVLNEQLQNKLAESDYKSELQQKEIVRLHMQSQYFEQLYLNNKEELRKCKRQRNAARVVAGIATAGLLFIVL